MSAPVTRGQLEMEESLAWKKWHASGSHKDAAAYHAAAFKARQEYEKAMHAEARAEYASVFGEAAAAERFDKE